MALLKQAALAERFGPRAAVMWACVPQALPIAVGWSMQNWSRTDGGKSRSIVVSWRNIEFVLVLIIISVRTTVDLLLPRPVYDWSE